MTAGLRQVYTELSCQPNVKRGFSSLVFCHTNFGSCHAMQTKFGNTELPEVQNRFHFQPGVPSKMSQKLCLYEKMVYTEIRMKPKIKLLKYLL